jgi:hypothetical protein
MNLNIEYSKKHKGYLPRPLIGRLGDPKGYLYTAAGDRNIQLLPGQFMHMKSYQEYVLDLRNRLKVELPVDEWLGQGYASTGIESGWDNMTQLIGYGMVPKGTPPHDSTEFRENSLNNSEYSIHHDFARTGFIPDDIIDVCKRTIRLLTGIPDSPKSIPVGVDAMLGLYSMELGIESPYGSRIINDWLTIPGEIANLISAKDTLSLASHGFFFGYSVGYRVQLNSYYQDPDTGLLVPKPRLVHDVHENWVQAEFNLPKDMDYFSGQDKFYRCRSRTINAGSLGWFPLRLMGRDGEQYFKEKYEFTNLTTGADNLRDKTFGATSLEMLDVESHDYSGGLFLQNLMADELKEYYEQWAVDLFIYAFRSPHLVRSDIPGLVKTEFRGSFESFDDYNSDGGNMSGNPCTSFIAKMWGQVYGVVGAYCRGDIKNTDYDIDIFLKGRHPRLSMLCAGDNIVYINKAGQTTPIRSLMPLAVLGESRSFLGYVPIQGQGTISWLPSPESAVKKFTHHDYSIASAKRPMWGLGWELRKDHYSTNPAAMRAIELMDETCADHFGFTITERAARHGHLTSLDIKDLTKEEREFIYSPKYLHYRFGIDKIRPELLERVYKTYDRQMLSKLYNTMIRR